MSDRPQPTLYTAHPDGTYRQVGRAGYAPDLAAETTYAMPVLALAEALDRIASLVKVSPEHRARMADFETGGGQDPTDTPNVRASDRTILVGQLDYAAAAIVELRQVWLPALASEGAVREAAEALVAVWATVDFLDPIDDETTSAIFDGLDALKVALGASPKEGESRG